MEIIKSLCPQPTKQVIIKKVQYRGSTSKLMNQVQNQDADMEDQSGNCPLKSKLFY